MPCYALLLEYDGAPFVGWQRQESGLSVQQVLEEAAARLNGGALPLVSAAGRTDAGVHAEGQVAQVTLVAALPPERVREALNFHTRPHPVAVLGAAVVDAAWSARFSAIGRAYRYRILNRRARPALDAGRVWHIQRPLDAAAMHAAAQGLLGRHDFSAFRAAACQAKSPLRTLDRLDVSRLGEEVVIVAEARSFLHHQVRNMVGTLVEVGLGRRPASWPRAVLDGGDRTRAGQTAPAEGLSLTGVRYDPPIAWA
ncbi:tRNA pseudouridine(38-40) synthase TruA [Roseomonas alkaliterrae]|uniref:tRNA pseudouridine synthase A n=1 Tax=Neoroseomonas alkaliterrae TaxID=1452450 RepID=A0A840XYP5_9PROT|nr:tRNA pseudouridine(38-40) synthase TruA [Neoroseomonas alkaliterrae]MBB5688921.1 tRNA pseudouridine38-40 synthase [Neoroseomonas alkaliterrae]MBR0677880.1 tRNA pseudouridine(38-40) synthase TruA [Neoroseomonas alkaliterrae]